MAVEFHHVVGFLEPNPVAAARAEKERKTGIGIDGDAMLATDDARDARVRQARVIGEAVLGNAHRLQIILQQDFARVDVGINLGFFMALVVIGDFNVVGDDEAVCGASEVTELAGR